ncbi:MAG: hypothetical protein M1409_00210 [Actinobacteria bacterium]|nr:hypothetical protein [Actinomycetota bacterium]
MNKSAIVRDFIEKNNGILRLKPSFVARDFLETGKRLGLKDEEYFLGERGWIAERWLGATNSAKTRLGPKDEGISYLNLENSGEITLKEAIELNPELIMGKEYSKTHNGLNRLAKIYSFKDRIQYHYHQMEKDAKLVGSNSKEEAYYFPENVDLGPHPETFFGVHPYIVEEKKQDILIPYLEDWNSDLILKHSRAYLQVPGEGFHIPSGILHAPGTAVTIELQEESDIFSMLQAKTGGKIIPKDYLYNGVSEKDREKYKERIILKQLDWEANGDPYFYENRHLIPVLVGITKQDGGEEYWIYYNTNKFSGKKLVIKPGKSFKSVDAGVYNIFVMSGKGTYGGIEIESGDFHKEELLICHDAAVKPLTVKNTGNWDLKIIKFFGPDINLDIPYIKKYKRS